MFIHQNLQTILLIFLDFFIYPFQLRKCLSNLLLAQNLHLGAQK